MALQQYQEEQSEILKKKFEVDIEDITEALAVRDFPIIHKDVYFNNFHLFFATGKEEYDGHGGVILNSWLNIVRTPYGETHIVDDDGELLFVHPGIMAKFDISGSQDSWATYQIYSDKNAEISPQHKLMYQKHHLDRFKNRIKDDRINDTDTHERFEAIHQYYIKHYTDGVEEEVDEVQEEVGVEETPKTDNSKWGDLF